jgi:hypothetical protein
MISSSGEFWAQEVRIWNRSLTSDELYAHTRHYESYGTVSSWDNKDLLLHWRLNDGASADVSGSFQIMDSSPYHSNGTAVGFIGNANNFTKFLEDYAYIPSIDYGWNQEKVRAFDGSSIDPQDVYQDERYVSLEFNMYDALNEDISHLIASYDELNNFLGLPINRYREDYEGLQQMRETYFKRLQGAPSFKTFVEMLDFFDMSTLSVVEKLLPASTIFNGDELVVESHMLERPKYQYQIRPIAESHIDISGTIQVLDRGDDSD